MIQATNRKKRCKTWRCPNLHTNKWGYCNECTAKYKAKHPEILTDEQRDKKREANRRYDEKRSNFRERGYTSEWTKFSREYLKRNPVCAICGAPAKVTDHKYYTADMMLDAWGKFDYDESHYQPLCVRCNTRKGLTEDERSRLEYQEMKFRLYQAELNKKEEENG